MAPNPIEVERPRAEMIFSSPAKAPGRHAKHYAPRAPAFWFEAHQREQLDLRDAVRLIEVDAAPAEFARQLYARLREADRSRPRAIYIEMPPNTPPWAANFTSA